MKRVDPGGARGSVLGELGVIFETSSRDPEGDCDTLGGSIRSESLQQAMEGKPLIQQYATFLFLFYYLSLLTILFIFNTTALTGERNLSSFMSEKNMKLGR